jgi:hypothetical protein
MSQHAVIKNLIQNYLNLATGEPIEKPNELLFIFTLNPDNQAVSIFIKRRSLKHFVESRVRELEKKHSYARVLEILFFQIENIEKVFLDKHKDNKDVLSRQIIKKDFSHRGYPNLCIVFEKINNHIEIVSVHFKKVKKVK